MISHPVTETIDCRLKHGGTSSKPPIRSIVEENARETLQRRGHKELTRVVCEYDERTGNLTLRGCVSSYYRKQLAQESVRNIALVVSVVNAIEVTETAGSPQLR